MTDFKVIMALCVFGLGMILYGCGCGGGGGGNQNSPTKAAIVFTSSLKSGYTDQIGSVNLTIELPDGVTVPADSAGLIPHSNLLFSGEGAKFATASTFAIVMGKYTPATPTAKATVSIVVNTLENSNGVVTGMNPGEFATLFYDLVPGTVIDTTNLTPLSGIVIANTKADILTDAVPPLAFLGYELTKR
jgi:hypothetical protein